MAYLMLNLADEKINGRSSIYRRNSKIIIYKNCFKVNLNFFAEKHGKSCRDTHFSMVSKFIQAESLTKKLTCSLDIVDAILKRQRMANENNKGDILNYDFNSF
jgi:hypothetical protein